MLWVLIAKDTLYLHKKKPIILKPVETTVEEENFRQRFSINELVYPSLISKGHFGEGVYFYSFIGGITPLIGYSFSIRGMPPTSNRIYINGIPLTNMMVSGLAPLPINEEVISSALVYRGDAPIEYDGFLGGVIDMKVEPYGGEAQVGLPTTYVFYRGLYGHYSNPTFIYGPSLLGLRGGNENLTVGLIRRFSGIKFTALYTKAWVGVGGTFSTEEGDVEVRTSMGLNSYGLSMLYARGPLRADLYLSGYDNTYDLKNIYGSNSRIVYLSRQVVVGGKVIFGPAGVFVERSYNHHSLGVALGDVPDDPQTAPFRVEHTTLAVFLGNRWNTPSGLFYAGFRLNFSSDAVRSDNLKSTYGIKGVVPTYRLQYKHFINDYTAFKVFLGSSYRNFAPLMDFPIVEVLPTPYFRRYPYVNTLLLGYEKIIGDYLVEVGPYFRYYFPTQFYDLGKMPMEGESFTDYMFRIQEELPAVSVGLDFTFLDKAKRDFRVSGFLGKSRYLGSINGDTPWDMRWSLGMETDMVSVLFTDGVPVYVWYDKCVERDEEVNCLRKETVFEAQRTFFTLVVGGGKSFTWKGWDVRWGIGNVLFWWNSLWGQAAYDPAAAYKTSPLLYMHLRRPL